MYPGHIVQTPPGTSFQEKTTSIQPEGCGLITIELAILLLRTDRKVLYRELYLNESIDEYASFIGFVRCLYK
jgi:hypothetical protein